MTPLLGVITKSALYAHRNFFKSLTSEANTKYQYEYYTLVNWTEPGSPD